MQQSNAGDTGPDGVHKYVTTAILPALPDTDEPKLADDALPTTSTIYSKSINEISPLTPDTTYHSITSEETIITVTKSEDRVVHEELESSIVYSESDSSQEELDILPPSNEGGFTESWEEVVTYEYEFDKDTGVKRIVLKPNILEVQDKQIFQSVDKSTPSPVVPHKKKVSHNLPEIEEDSIVVYELRRDDFHV